MSYTQTNSVFLQRRVSSIEAAAITCRQSIEKCLAVEALTHTEWVQNRLADFNLWASGLGVFAGSRASLDYRLIHQPDTMAVLTAVLQTLATGFERCQELGLKIDRGETIEQAHGDESTSLEEDPDDLPPRSFSPWSDESSSTSDSGNPWNSTPDHEREPILFREIHNTETLLDQLITLGAAIRKSGTVSRLRKADDSFKPENHHDFRKYLVRRLLLEPSDVEDSRCPKTCSVDYEVTTRRLSALQEQLVFANLVRRNRFDYFRLHARKLATPHIAGNLLTRSYDARGRGIDDGKEHAEDNGQVPTDDATQGVAHQKFNQKSSKKPALTETTASSIEPGKMNAIPTRLPTPSQQEQSQISVTAATLEYPKPPPGAGNQTIGGFKCPCCCQILPHTFAGRQKWRKHLSEDLCPYTCLFTDCGEKTRFYATKQEWKAHLKAEHPATLYWECPACDPKEQFPTKERFVAHCCERHRQSISEEHLPMFIEACSFKEPVKFEKCPLCERTPEEQELGDPDLFLDHIGDCIHSFSLQALPWMKKSEKDDLKASGSWLVDRIKRWLLECPRKEGDVEQIPDPDLKWSDSDDDDDFTPEEYFAEDQESGANASPRSSIPRDSRSVSNRTQGTDVAEDDRNIPNTYYGTEVEDDDQSLLEKSKEADHPESDRDVFSPNSNPSSAEGSAGRPVVGSWRGSSLEILGIVLGSMPLLIVALQQYSHGFDVIRSLAKYRSSFSEIVIHFSASASIFTNDCEDLLSRRLMLTDQQYRALMDHTESGDDNVAEKLIYALGKPTYDVFMQLLFHLRSKLDRLRRKLELGTDLSVPFIKDGILDEKECKEFFRGWKRIFGPSLASRIEKYKRLVTEIEVDIDKIHNVTTRAVYAEDRRRSQRSAKEIPRHWLNIHHHTSTLFRDLSSSWPDICPAPHTHHVQLLDPLQIEALPWEHRSATLLCERTSSKKTVQFAVENAAQRQEFCSSQACISNLCAALSAPTSACLGILQHKDYLYHVHDVEVVEPQKLSLLQDLIDGKEVLWQRKRCDLALNLAYTVFQFAGTPWLRDKWNLKDIQFSESGVRHHLWVSKTFCPDISPMGSREKTEKRFIIKNDAVFSLGTALLELACGRPLSSFQIDNDLDENGNEHDLTRYLIADRLLRKLQEEDGPNFVSAVSKCIYPASETHDFDLANEGFRKSFFRDVIIPLQEDHDQLFKKRV